MGLSMDPAERELLAETLRKTMAAASGEALDGALGEIGWPDLLAEFGDVAVPMVFGLLGETGAHAPLLNDVLLAASGRPVGSTVALPFTGGSWVVWDRADSTGIAVDGELPLRRADAGEVTPLSPAALDAGRRALGWWLVGTGRAMLDLARSHVLTRTQFGRPLASFQAVRHRLAETLVALEGAEATLLTAESVVGSAEGGLGALLAKAAAGSAALTAGRHCGQVLGGIGFTAEHDFQGHFRRVLVLDGLLGSARELTREAGRLARRQQHAPRLAQL